VNNARYGMTKGRARRREKGRGGKNSSETAGYASPVKDLKADAQLMISSFLYNATFSGIDAKFQESGCFANQFHPPKTHIPTSLRLPATARHILIRSQEQTQKQR
jgi:hypothetical protein